LGIIPGLLDLRWVANTDTAFSLMHSYVSEKTRLGILTAVSIFTTIAIGSFVAFRWRKASTTERIAGALLLGGGLGNVVDRLAHGHVVDFIHLHYWPVFNVADISLCLGVGLLFLSSLRQKQAVI
jgi:signal peptidase II